MNQGNNNKDKDQERNNRIKDSKKANIKKKKNIYIYAVELKTGPRFGVSSVKNWSKSSVKNWSNFFAVFSPVL